MRRLFLLAALSFPLVASAQMNAPAKPIAPGATVAPAKALDDLLSLVEHEFVPAAKAMPADKYGFAPQASTFASSQAAEFKGVRTFVQQVTHVAEANYFFFSGLSDIKPDVDMRGIEKLSTKDEAVDALEKSFAYGHRVIATINNANAFTEVKAVDGMRTRTTVAAFAAAHAFDHYGQIVEYLRMNGIVPPASAK